MVTKTEPGEGPGAVSFCLFQQHMGLQLGMSQEKCDSWLSAGYQLWGAETLPWDFAALGKQGLGVFPKGHIHLLYSSTVGCLAFSW